jgi:glycosyltransferase involved in cell wall biosynthesis
LKLAVDAWNLADDHRGMGRYVRRILSDFERESDLDVTLLTRKDPRAKENFDAIWYPWNGLRFEIPRARSLVTMYDPFAFTYPARDFVARWREQNPIRRAAKQATVLATISAWSASELARVLDRNVADFTIIPPVPDAFWQPTPAAASIPYVLVVAGPDERKNIPTLVRAFARAFPPRSCTLHVAGNLSAKDTWLLERSGIAFVRSKPTDAELRELYSDALCIAIPSSAEGYGLMSVEAMACGAPVVASNAAAVPEACDGAALLVPPFDVDAWAFTLERVATDATLRATLREQSLARAARIDRAAPARLTLEVIRRSLEGAR